MRRGLRPRTVYKDCRAELCGIAKWFLHPDIVPKSVEAARKRGHSVWTLHGISGLVVEYIVAIDVTRVRFPADAFSIEQSIAFECSPQMSEVLRNAGEACLVQMPGCLHHIQSARPAGEFLARLPPQRSSQQ